MPQNPFAAAQAPFGAREAQAALSQAATRHTPIKPAVFQSIHLHFIYHSANYQHAFKTNTSLNKRKPPVNHGHDRLMANAAKMIYLPALSNKASYANTLLPKYEETSN